MTVNEFTDLVVTRLNRDLDENVTVTEIDVLKNNGVSMHGIRVGFAGNCVSPTIYMEDFLKKYEAGEPLTNIYSELLGIINREKEKVDIDVKFFCDYNQVKSRICHKIISREKNKELLEEIPHVPFLDMEIVFYYAYSGRKIGNGSILVRNCHMNMWGCDVDELLSISIDNTMRLFPPTTMSLIDVLMQISGDECDDLLNMIGDRVLPMYVLTNSSRIFGASSFLYKEFIQDIADEYDSDIYILPSSVHETILLPKLGADADELREMVQTINYSQVDPVEVLSDNVYLYERATNEISIA